MSISVFAHTYVHPQARLVSRGQKRPLGKSLRTAVTQEAVSCHVGAGTQTLILSPKQRVPLTFELSF